jgi:hypothetical protein
MELHFIISHLIPRRRIPLLQLAILVIFSTATASVHATPTPPIPFSFPLGPASFDLSTLAPASGRWTTGPLPDDSATAEPALLHGEDGLLLAPGDHTDFALTLRLRFDDLRYQARLPQAGIVFAARDRRDHAAVVFDRLNGRLHLLRIAAGKPTTLASSERNAVHPLHRWLWLRVERRTDRLRAALSTDGIRYEDYIDVPLPADLGPGRLGLVADIPATTFAPATPPALLVRDSGDWAQDASGSVTARLVRETFTPAIGLLREPFIATFPTGTPSSRSASEAVTLPNPATRQPFRFSAFRPVSSSLSFPSSAELLTLFNRVVRALSRRDSYVRLGTADAYAATRDPALSRLLAADASTALRDFTADGRTPISFAELYPTLRVLALVQRDSLLPATELAAISSFARQALLRASHERGPMNRAIGLLAAIGPGIALAGDDFPEADTLREVARRVEADLAARDFFPLEDSTNYQLISLYFTLCWARDANRDDVLRAPGLRAAFDQLLDLLGPDATLPAYGDDYSSHPGVLLGLFTAAAHHLNDPRFAVAATRVHARHFAPDAPLPPKLVGEDAMGLGLASASASAISNFKFQISGFSPPSADRALILRRPDGSLHKAVLATGSGLGALHLVLDLANAYEHGHHDALALVSLVAGADSLLPDAGRYARAAWFHNRPLVADTPDAFPRPPTLGEQSRRMMDDGLAPGVWHPLSFSLRQHWIWGNFAGDLGLPPLPRAQYHRDIPADFTYDPARQSALLLALAGAGPVRLETRSARLTGPAGSRPLPEFDRHEELTLTQALSDAQDVTFRGTVLAARLDLKSPDYDRLEFDLRLTPLSPATTVALNSVIVGDADGYPKRQIPPDSPAEIVHVRATATAPGLAAILLETDTRSPAGHPARLTRLVVALADRGVWVRDTFENLSSATALHVGPAWHFSTAQLDPATGWLESPGLRVAIAPAPATTHRLDHHRRYGLDTPLVYSAGAPLVPDARLVRHSFLAPTAAPAAPSTWSATDDTLTLDGRPLLRIQLAADHTLSLHPLPAASAPTAP